MINLANIRLNILVIFNNVKECQIKFANIRQIVGQQLKW